MAEIEPLTPSEVSDLLSGLTEAPVPEGMAQRAVHRWIEESRGTGSRSRPAMHMGLSVLRPIAALAAAAILVVVVRSRIGDGVAPDAGQSVASSAERATRSAKAVETAPSPLPLTKGAARESKAKGRGTTAPSAGAPRVAEAFPPVRADKRTRAVSQLESEKAFADSGAGEAQPPAPALQEARRAEAPDADLAYLNAPADADRSADGPPSFADARLAKPVSLTEDEITFADLSGRIGGDSGVDIVLPARLAQQPIAIHCSDRPVGEVLRMVARALDIRWEVSGSRIPRRYAAVPPHGDKLATADGAVESMAGRMGLAGAAGMRAAPGAARSDAAGHARGGVLLNIIGSPARVRALRQEGAAPPDAVRTDGWIIVR